MLPPSVAVLEYNLTSYRRVWRASVLSSFALPVLFLLGMGVSVGSYVDARGALGTDTSFRNGFERIRMTFRVRGDAPPEKLREIVARGHGRSVVFDSITRGVPVTVDVVTD